MIRYLLDTNIMSEVRKSRPHDALLAWLSNLRDQGVRKKGNELTYGSVSSRMRRERWKNQTRALEKPKETCSFWVDSSALDRTGQNVSRPLGTNGY
jgi:predicted nucleic acid-binding protein